MFLHEASLFRGSSGLDQQPVFSCSFSQILQPPESVSDKLIAVQRLFSRKQTTMDKSNNNTSASTPKVRLYHIELEMEILFVDEATSVNWVNEVVAVMRLAPQKPPVDYRPFIKAVEDLRGKWGGKLVPHCIKNFLSQVETKNQWPLTVWTPDEMDNKKLVDATHLGPVHI